MKQCIAWQILLRKFCSLAMFAVTGILIVALSGCLSFKLTENSAAEIAMGMENDKGGGLGVVGAQDPIKFLLLKVAQLETVTEMQQAEIESLKARGSEESVQTRQAEATSIMKKVWRKHEHQRRTGTSAATRVGDAAMRPVGPIFVSPLQLRRLSRGPRRQLGA